MLADISTSDSVCVHIRKGDYTNSVNSKIYIQLTHEYYLSAVSYISKVLEFPRFFVFSDDISWVKENIYISGDVIHVENIGSDIDEFQLMMSCKNFIIANSTFSWWAARLSSNINKVIIAPKKWFRDEEIKWKIVPENWMKL
jgi:hypothetical protein